MKLRAFLEGIRILETNADMEMEITDVAYDSRKVKVGGMFVAIKGFTSDGNRFVPMAREKGATVVVTTKRPNVEIPYVLVESDRYALAMIGTNFFGKPAQSMTMIGITGTNGKTSVTVLLKQVLEQTIGAKVGLIGTMGNMIGQEHLPSERTTPESFELQALFARMRDAGCTHVVMEVSSHALALDRVAGIHFQVAAFTNLTEDHLDFHKTMDEYCEAKALLFARCDNAVINADDAYAHRMLEKAKCPVITCSARGQGGLNAKDLQLHAEGICFTAAPIIEKPVQVKLSIPGKFTVYNALTVLAVARALRIPLEDAAQALSRASGVKGRIEVVPTPGKPYSVLIDYAHTPDALENVLTAVKDFCKGRVIAVFGCGGDRDPIKRPIMGQIGVTLSDFAVITSDNPRTEDPVAIINDILQGVKKEMGDFVVIPERRSAIRYAMDIAKKDDIIVLAGKGHETYQEINGMKYHLDEREEVTEYLSESR